MERQRWDHAQMVVRWQTTNDRSSAARLVVYPAGSQPAVSDMGEASGEKSTLDMLDLVERQIPVMGADGWELVGVMATVGERAYWFKRPAD